MKQRRPPLNNRQIRAEDRFIIAMAVIIGLIILIAMFGYIMGGWEQQP